MQNAIIEFFIHLLCEYRWVGSMRIIKHIILITSARVHRINQYWAYQKNYRCELVAISPRGNKYRSNNLSGIAGGRSLPYRYLYQIIPYTGRMYTRPDSSQFAASPYAKKLNFMYGRIYAYPH